MNSTNYEAFCQAIFSSLLLLSISLIAQPPQHPARKQPTFFSYVARAGFCLFSFFFLTAVEKLENISIFSKVYNR
jgi:hypothetical protein